MALAPGDQERVAQLKLRFPEQEHDWCEEYDEEGNLLRLSCERLKITEFPPELSQFPQLRHLNMSFNQLHSLPAEVGQLSSLRVLNLHANQLSGLPPEIGQLSSLRALNLSGNQLSSLPAEMGQISSLLRLDLRGNPILQHVPAERVQQVPRALLAFLRDFTQKQ